jgi:parallel beta-helix repeat protein
MRHARIVPLVVALSFGLFLSACGTPSTQENASNPSSITDSSITDSSITDPTDLQANAVTGNGLNAEYFSTIGFTGPSIKRIVPNVNVDFGATAPIPGINASIFSIRFTGQLSAPTTGTYTFYVTATDGDRLTLGGQIVLEDFTNHLPRTATGTFNLVAGQKVPLKLEYFKNTGTGSLKLEWSGPGVARQVIGTAQLFAVVPPIVPPVVPPVAQPGVFYLAPNGNNNNPGTEALPWQTFGHAAYTLKPGQTVLVKNGTYTETLYIYKSGEPGKPITYKAFPGAKPKIEIRTKELEGVLIEGASYITIDGFFLDYTAPGAPQAKGEQVDNGIDVTYKRGSPAVLSHHINIFNNRVHGFPGAGISAIQSDYVRIEANTVWENNLWSKYATSGISFYQSVDQDKAAGFHSVIRGNTVFNNENRVSFVQSDPPIITDGNCIIIDDLRQTQKFMQNNLTQYPVAKGGVLIENNICAGNGARGVHVYSSDNVLARHNTLYQNQLTSSINDGELTAFDADNVRFVNNIVYTRPGKRATGIGNATNVVFARNLYFGTTDIPNKSSSDLIGDPKFVTPGTNLFEANFRLQDGSAATDLALAGQSPAIDVSWSPRPKGKAADIGAWESR